MGINELRAAAGEYEGSPAQSGEAGKAPKTGELRIEASESGSSFYLVAGREWIMFSRDEGARLAKIVNGPGTDLEIRERLLAWLDRERKDIFAALPIQDKFDDRLKKLAVLFRSSFKRPKG
jgi:hypothetical protein